MKQMLIVAILALSACATTEEPVPDPVFSDLGGTWDMSGGQFSGPVFLYVQAKSESQVNYTSGQPIDLSGGTFDIVLYGVERYFLGSSNFSLLPGLSAEGVRFSGTANGLGTIDIRVTAGTISPDFKRVNITGYTISKSNCSGVPDCPYNRSFTDPVTMVRR